LLTIFVDADGCPVKDEIFRVAVKWNIRTVLVSNRRISHPAPHLISSVVVREGFDSADDYIAVQASVDDIVITADIPLASRALEKDARVINPNGRTFTKENIGDALASRELMSSLREQGMITGGPAPIKPKDRSLFLHVLQETIQEIKRENGL